MDNVEAALLCQEGVYLVDYEEILALTVLVMVACNKMYSPDLVVQLRTPIDHLPMYD